MEDNMARLANTYSHVLKILYIADIFTKAITMNSMQQPTTCICGMELDLKCKYIVNWFKKLRIAQ